MEAGHEQVCLAVGVVRLVHPSHPREHLFLSGGFSLAIWRGEIAFIFGFSTTFQHFDFFYRFLLLPFQQEALYVFPLF